MNWDRILTINDYYDGPRRGIAEVNGVPHVYEAEFDHSTDEYGDTYRVSPVDEELLSLVLEDWAIWLRWDAAYKRGEVSLETHPALPEDRDRRGAIKLAVGDRLKADPARWTRQKAEFRNLRIDGNWSGTEVRWSECDS